MIERIKKFLFSGNIRSVQAKKHIIYSFLWKSISILVGLIYVPLILNYLDQERYGVWLTLASMITWMNFFDIGLGNGLRNNLVKALAENDTVTAKKLVSTTYFLLTVIIGALFLVFFVANFFLPWQQILNTQSVPGGELMILTLIVFSMFAARFVLKLIGVIFLADQKPAYNNALEPLAYLISLVLIIILTQLQEEGSLLILGAILSSKVVVVYTIASFIYFNSRYKSIRPSWKFIDLSYKDQLIQLGVKFFFIQIGVVILISSSNFIITQVLGPSAVTPFVVAKQYFMIPIMGYSIVMSPIWSAVTDAYNKDEYSWLKNALKKLNYLSLAFVVLVIIMFFAAPFVFEIWIGDKLEISFLTTMGLSVYATLTVIGSPYSQFINGFGKLKIGMIIVTIKIIVFVPTSILLLKYLQDPAGAIFATILVHSLGFFFEYKQVKYLINKKAYGIWNR